MAKADAVRLARIVHTIVAIFTLLAGGALLGFGIYLSVSGNKGPFNLDYSGSSVWRTILALPIIAMVFGSFLIVTAIVSLVSLATNCLGVTFRVIYVILAAIIFSVLVVICVLSGLLYSHRHRVSVKDFVHEAWDRTAKSDPSVICRIEKDYKCRGFTVNNCLGCPTGYETACSVEPIASVCPKCDHAGFDPSTGCYGIITSKLVDAFLPVSIVSGILAFTVLLDMILSCLL